MTVAVPEDKAEGLGVRPAISKADATEVLDLLAVRDVRVPANWSRRFKNHQEKLKSGDVYQCAEVVRNLAARLREKSLSAAEQSMYAKARYILISELAVSWSIDDEKAAARVDAALGLTADVAPASRYPPKPESLFSCHHPLPSSARPPISWTFSRPA